MVWRLIFHKGRLFFSPASACSSGAEAEGANSPPTSDKMLQTPVSEHRGCLATIQELKWQIWKGKKPQKTMICQGTDWFFESLFEESAVLSPLFLCSSSAITFKGVFRWAGNQERAGENSHFCAWCVPGGEGAMPPMGSVILWFSLSLFTRAHPSLVPVFSSLGKTHFSRVTKWTFSIATRVLKSGISLV